MRLLVLVVATLLPGAVTPIATAQPARTDLDDLMARALTRRDESWRTLQQYVLDERQIAGLRGPDGTRLYGLDREYTWYIRDGIFVRSPVRVDGVELSEEERRRYEEDWLARELARQKDADTADADAPEAVRTPADPDELAQLVREPRFISAAHFLEFEFEPGRYALVGPEQYEGRRVLRIEYYPTRLFSDDESSDRPGEADRGNRDEDREDRLEAQMNKVALVTLWVDPAQDQIVKYTFENLDMDFMPGRWLARVEDIRATMRMHEPFPGVWLPRDIEAEGAVTVAAGSYSIHYRVAYHNYREADVKARIR